eukprot:scaffold4110_cov77-Skeletonema_dohrnii-CCMP3373.AAC.14
MAAAAASKQPWAYCKAIPTNSNNTDAAHTPYYHSTYYGPGELETYKHTQLQQDVKDAKLKIWYPGIWHRPSPRALFRIHLNAMMNSGGGDLVLLKLVSNSIIVSSWFHLPTCHQMTTLQWQSKLINTMSNERVYEHTLLSIQSTSKEHEKDNNSAVVEEDEWFKDCCVIIELDTREEHSHSRKLGDKCSETQLHAPPCISLVNIPDLTTTEKVEWRPLLCDSTQTCDPAEVDGFKIPITTSDRDDDNEVTSSSAGQDESSYEFPHQQDLCKVCTIHPSTIEHNSTQTCHEITCDFGREILGHVRITILPSKATIPSSSSVEPPIQLRVGETHAEALNDNEEHFEQSIDLCTDGDDNTMWLSSHLLAFRYVRIIIASDDDIDPDEVTVACSSQEAEIDNAGSLDFGPNAPSDNNILDRNIWDCAAATLKLCIHQNFIVDGIKRDRLPWLGDVVVSLMANAYSFHDMECIRWSLSVLGRCGMEKLYCNANNNALEEEVDARVQVAESHVNGIVDYSLWFFICHWLYQRYFGDESFLRQEWPLLETRLVNLIQWCSDKNKGWFIEHESEWIFIDWTVEGDKSEPLQIIWWWALDCAHDLAKSMLLVGTDDESKENSVVELIKDVQSKLETSLMERDDIQAGYSRHAHLLGVLSGLYSRLDDRASGDWWDPDTSDERAYMIRKSRKLVEESRSALLGKDLAAVATPYMKHLECLALIRLDERSTALDQVRKYWGGMLETGATTFYEAFNEGESISDVAAFYDRPYARSLCHAWSAGPCALYPEILLGIRPLSDGWKEWACSPMEGVSSVTSEVNTMYGTIRIDLNQTQLRVSVPDGTTMKLMNKSYEGGLHCIPRSVLISSELTTQWSKKYRSWHYHDKHVIPPNPIIAGHEGIQMTDVPTVFQLPGDETFYMSFIGFDGTGYQSFIAESSDLVQWTKFRLAMGFGEERSFDFGGVVLGAYHYESYHIDAPRVLKKANDDKFLSLYGAYEKKNTYEPDPGYQGLASSSDGMNWKREKDESILSIHGPGEVSDWEKHSIYQPWLVEHDGVYYNFYNAKQMPEWIEQIGIAKSQCLYEWERHNDNPIISVSRDGFDTQFCSDAKVFWDAVEKHWAMFFYGVGRGAAHIMIAFSRDLIHWERDTTPLYQAGGNPSGLDKKYAHKVSLVYNPRNETFYMFYCAVGDEGRGIGLITSKPL